MDRPETEGELVRIARLSSAAQLESVVRRLRRADPAADGRCELEDGPNVSAESARRIACDCSRVVMVEGGTGETAASHRSRVLSVAQERALRERDGGHCTFPGCGHRIVEAHHARHWAGGDPTWSCRGDWWAPEDSLAGARASATRGHRRRRGADSTVDCDDCHGGDGSAGDSENDDDDGMTWGPSDGYSPGGCIIDLRE